MPAVTNVPRVPHSANAPAAGRGPAGELCFRLATGDDDAALRRLLRENPMGGDVRLSLEREPSYFAAAAIEGPAHRTIVAVEGGRVVCAGSVSARLRYVNGRPTWVGYLGGLRLDAGCRNRMSIVRGGYAVFRRLHEDGAFVGPAVPAAATAGAGVSGGSSPTAGTAGATNAPSAATNAFAAADTSALRGHTSPNLYFTSIAADNLPARRLLERGLPGMPTYRFVGEMVTLVIRRRQNGDFYKPTAKVRGRLGKAGLSLQYGNDPLVADLVELLNENGAGYQFSPVWTAEDLATPGRCPGLAPDDFRLVRSADGTAVACAAFWDQRESKQTVVRGYAPRLGRLRLFLNVGLAIAGRPTLPRVGRPISHAYVSHLASGASRPDVVEQLIWLLHGPADTRGVDYLTLGLDARDPQLPHLRRVYRPREYRSRLYAVHWDDAGADLARGLDGRLLAPEVALL